MMGTEAKEVVKITQVDCSDGQYEVIKEKA